MPPRRPLHTPPGPPRESAERKRARAARIVALLRRRYPDPQIPLRHRSPFELLIATILSAQCTDEMVNRVTPLLFERFPTPEAMAAADIAQLRAIVRPTGFYQQKSATLQACARALLERHGGEIPPDMDHLTRLPGVGRKTANVLFSAAAIEQWPDWPHAPRERDGTGIVVDTHVARLSRRLALSLHTDPVKIEQDLMALIPRREWARFALRLIYFGREICTAKQPKCPFCPLSELCPSSKYLGRPPWMERSRSGAAKPDRRRARAPNA
ncbi:MAG: endonuclease III [Armatimonadota bacterium]|nr:endonuclease III [Armatimonadota bacterium]MDR5696788.1 endonuclease III [Armatimonadota bacterium]